MDAFTNRACESADSELLPLSYQKNVHEMCLATLSVSCYSLETEVADLSTHPFP